MAQPITSGANTPPTPPALTEAEKRKENERLHKRNSHRREALLAGRNVEFIKLDPTEEEKQKIEARNNIANSNAMGVLQPLDPTIPDLYTPGTYKTDPDLGFHIFHDKHGGIRPLRDPSLWLDGLLDLNDEDVLMLEHGAVIDYVMRGTGCSSITYDFPKDSHSGEVNVDQRVLLAAMKAALERGAGFEFGENTMEGINKWPKAERELWYKFKDDVNTHAKKRQLLLGINGKAYEKYTEELDATTKLDLNKSNEDLTKELFTKASATEVTQEQLAELGQVIDSTESRASKLKQKQEEVRSKLNSMEQVLANPNFLETPITMPKNWGRTHEDSIVKGIKDIKSGGATTKLKAVGRILFYHVLPTVVPVLGAVPYLIHRKLVSRTKEVLHGSLDPAGVVTKMQDGWKAASTEVENLIAATQKENADLAKRQELIEKEIERIIDNKLTPEELTKLEAEIANLEAKLTPEARADFEAEKNILDSELTLKEAAYDSAQKELSRLQNELLHTKSDLITLSKEIAAMPDNGPDGEIDVEISPKLLEKAALGEQVTKLENQIREREPKITIQGQEVEQLKQQKTQLDLRDPEKLGKDLEATKAKKDGGVSDNKLNKDMSEKLKDLKTKQESLKTAIADNDTAIKELKTKKTSMAQKISAAQSQAQARPAK